MADNSKEKFNEKVISHIINSRFYPELIDDENNVFVDKDLFKIMDGARSYDEARNLLIGYINDANKENKGNVVYPKEIERAIKNYIGMYDPDGKNKWSIDTFRGDLDTKNIKPETMSIERLAEEAAKISRALGADPNEKSSSKDFIKTIFNQEVDKNQLNPDKAKFINKIDEFIKSGNDPFITSANFYQDTGFLGDNKEYANDYMYRVLKRMNDYNQAQDMNEAVKGVESFVYPYTAEKQQEAKTPNPADYASDFINWWGSGKLGTKSAKKASKSEDAISKIMQVALDEKKAKEAAATVKMMGDFAGITALGSLYGSLTDRAHDVADAPFNKEVFAFEGMPNEVSEREKAFSEDNMRLSTLLPEIKQGIESAFIMSPGGIFGRKMMNSDFVKKAKKKVRNGIDSLFGVKNSKEELKKLAEDKRRIEKGREDWHKKDSQREVIFDDDQIKESEKILKQIEEDKKAITDKKKKAFETYNKVNDGLNALLYSGVAKSYMNPDENRSKKEKARAGMYAIDFLN